MDAWRRLIDEGVKVMCEPEVAESVRQDKRMQLSSVRNGKVKVPGLSALAAVTWLRRSGVSRLSDAETSAQTDLRNNLSEVRGG